MTGRYKAYPEYKSTDEVWLGDVPSHWRALQINRLTIIKRGASPRPIDDPKYFHEEGEYSWVRIADVTASDTYLENTTQRLSSLGSSLSVKLEPNELFLSIAGTVGKPCINKIKACIHDGFVYFPEYKENVKFLFYIFAAGEAYKGLGKFGTQLNLNTETVGGIKIGIPCIDEQEKIVNFLDHETAKIDTLITKQEKLIELLKEKRQAVISHAVTKGLNPDVKMKDSGVEWLGEVPEHWSIRRVKNCALLVSEKETIDGQSVIALENIESLTGKFVKSESTYSGEDVAFIKDDILFSKLRPYLAKVYRCQGKGIAFGDLLTYRPFSDTNSSFLFYSMISAWFIEIVDSSTYGAKMPRASSDFVSEMYIPFPPQKEQEEIAKYLDKTLLIFDELSQKSKNTINLMQERKTALISAAVTGKIDVRDWESE